MRAHFAVVPGYHKRPTPTTLVDASLELPPGQGSRENWNRTNGSWRSGNTFRRSVAYESAYRSFALARIVLSSGVWHGTFSIRNPRANESNRDSAGQRIPIRDRDGQWNHTSLRS